MACNCVYALRGFARREFIIHKTLIGNDLNLSDSNYFGAVNVILSTYEQLGQGHATRI